MKNILFTMILFVAITISSKAQEQIFEIAHVEASTPNGYVLDDISIHIKFEKTSNGDTKIYVIPDLWKVSYKYNGKIYKYGSSPFNGENHKDMFEPKYTSFYIYLSDGKKLKASIWPKATKEYHYYELLCCSNSYKVSKIELNPSQNLTNANIEQIIERN